MESIHHFCLFYKYLSSKNIKIKANIKIKIIVLLEFSFAHFIVNFYGLLKIPVLNNQQV